SVASVTTMTLLPATGGACLKRGPESPNAAAEAADAGVFCPAEALGAADAGGDGAGPPLGLEQAGVRPTRGGTPRRGGARKRGCGFTPPYVSHFPRSALVDVKWLRYQIRTCPSGDLLTRRPGLLVMFG